MYIRNQQKNTVERIIRRFVEVGCCIWHDDAKWYDWLDRCPDYTDRTCKHKGGFFISEGGATTNPVEGLFGHSKTWARGLRGVPEIHLPGYLDEYMWRHLLENETVVESFKRMLRDLGHFSRRSDFN